MQPDSTEYESVQPSQEPWDHTSTTPQPEDTEVSEGTEQTWFHSHFEDSMEMYADARTVAEHFNNHQTWFARCAVPMKVEPIGENGYDLLIGRFGAFSYIVEARIGLELLPPDAQGIYRILTIPIPNYKPPGYDVDFRSKMQLLEVAIEQFATELSTSELAQLPPVITSVNWQLDLSVGLYFPKFIRGKSHSLIQKTGENVLDKIVRQVNRRLTYKTQQVFHESLGIALPQSLRKRKLLTVNC
ncbi:hypothetical protein BCD67_23460 [Oscillatoriales cyanobacterium USR001]|nr:hypothetical protein BCD67_23460 [Oscillatoriales cyanobacterium USR001]